jgi:hypothetical protein
LIRIAIYRHLRAPLWQRRNTNGLAVNDFYPACGLGIFFRTRARGIRRMALSATQFTPEQGKRVDTMAVDEAPANR